MQCVHVVKLLLELEPELDFFLVRLYLLTELFLDLLAEELLLVLLLLQLVFVLLERVERILEVPLVVAQLLDVLCELPLHRVHHLPVLLVQLRYQHLVIRLATVLKEDGEDAPEGGQEDVLVRGMMEATLEHLIVTDGINKETAVDSVNLVTRDPGISQ